MDAIKQRIARKDFSAFNDEAELIKWLKRHEANIDTVADARKWMTRKIPKETYYQGKIIKYLESLSLDGAPIFVWKSQAGMYQKRGIPDVCSIINGKFYGFEVKRPILGITSDLQIKIGEKIIHSGGRWFIVTYVGDVKKILQNYKIIK